MEDPCTANPCEHGGSCQVQLDSFVCTCTPEYEGRNCSIGIPLIVNCAFYEYIEIFKCRTELCH